jgi:hypothetical protein
VILKVNRLYKLGNSIYDPWDERLYTVKIIQEPMIFSNDEYYYKAQIIKMEGIAPSYPHFIHLYPEDWEIVEELSSLEMELL